MFNAKYDDPLDRFVIENPDFTRVDLENHLESLEIYTGKTPERSINRDVLKYLRKNYPEFEKKSTKEVKETRNERIQESLGGDLGDIHDDRKWRRKLLKTGRTTNPKWKTSTNIEIYTFIDEDDDKFDNDLSKELFDGILTEIPDMSDIDESGYSDNLIDEFDVDKLYIYPSSNLVINGKSKEVILR